MRGVTPEQMIEVFDMDPASARLLTAREAWDEFTLGGRPWVWVRQVGDWAFAIDPELGLDGVDAAQRLSAGTEAATLEMLTLAVGIRLPEEIAEGPLFTCQLPLGTEPPDR